MKHDPATHAEPSHPDTVTVRFSDKSGNPADPVTVPTVQKSDAEWRAEIGDEAFRVLRSSATERPFCGGLLDNKVEGIYTCRGCDLPLFASRTKFNSGTGWPSFFQPFAAENIGENRDMSHGMVRIEVHCARCGGHLGHVFPDGPAPTKLRYCINSAALDFQAF